MLHRSKSTGWIVGVALIVVSLLGGVSKADDATSEKSIRSARILVDNKDFDGADALLRPPCRAERR